ncbi:MAG TPA: sugar nucleotide-binding protein [Gemmataceae bacterium]|jgi:dTDP-4-dehydrorhamnose reductase
MRWLITGASGLLGGYLLRLLGAAGEPVVAWGGPHAGEPVTPMDLADPDAVTAAFRSAKSDVVLHAAALARLGDCHRDPAGARHTNTDGSRLLAELAAEARARMVFVSTDLVFDGGRGNYRETDAPNPLSVYGRTKADAEAAVLAFPRTAVARLSLLFGPTLTGRPSFFDQMLAALRGGPPVALFADEWRTPLALPAAAEALAALARSDVTGLLHVGGPERLSRADMGRLLAEAVGGSPTAFTVTTRAAVPAPEPRPADTSLDSSRWRGLFPALPWPTYRAALATMVAG